MAGCGKLNIDLSHIKFVQLGCDLNQPVCCASCRQQIPVQNFVALAVTDTGIGISDEIIDKISDPFFTTKGVGEGRGMGLSIVYGLVHQLGGHLLVNSLAATGTEFVLLLPIASKQACSKIDSIVVEQQKLHNKQHHSSIALVLTDQTMPELTGIEFSHKIRTINPDIPIVICSGFSEQLDADQAKRHNINAGSYREKVLRKQIAVRYG